MFFISGLVSCITHNAHRAEGIKECCDRVTFYVKHHPMSRRDNILVALGNAPGKRCATCHHVKRDKLFYVKLI